LEALEEVAHDGVLEMSVSSILIIQNSNTDTLQLYNVRTQSCKGLKFFNLQRFLPTKRQLMKRYS